MTLDWIDAALGAGVPTTADPVGREVQELALVLQAESPEPDPGFGEELDTRVEAGFPRRVRPRLPGPRMLAAGGGLAVVAATIVAAIVVATSDHAARTTAVRQPPQQAPAAPMMVQPPSLYDDTERRALSTQQAFGAPSSHVGADARRVQRSAEVTLATRGDRLQQLADDVAAVTGRHHG